MAIVSVVLVAAYRQIWGSDHLVWSKGRRPPGARAALAKWTRWKVAVAVHCYDDSTINIVVAITIYYYVMMVNCSCNKYSICTVLCISGRPN